MLKLTEDTPVLYSERCDLLNGVPFAWDCGYIPLRFAKQITEEDLTDVALVERWSEKENLQISSIQQTIQTVTDPTAARHLKLCKTHPLLKTTECYFDRRNRPCGVFITCYNPELVQLRIRYAAGVATN